MPSSAAAKRTTRSKDYSAAFAALRKVLARYAAKMHVAKDNDSWYCLETKSFSNKGKRHGFAAVAIMKGHVGFYLMAIYMEPALTKPMSPELRRRQQGKCCFNFQRPDPELFKQLAQLTKSGYDYFEKKQLL